MKELSDEQKILFDNLTKKQQSICIYSLQGLSDIDAYRKGGGKAKTIASAGASASKIFNNPRVKAFLDSIKHNAVSEAVMSRQEILEQLSVIGRSNIDNLVTWDEFIMLDKDGNEHKQSAWTLRKNALQSKKSLSTIAEIKAGKGGIQIKMHSSLQAMKMISEIAGYNVNPDQKPQTDVSKAVAEVKKMNSTGLMSKSN